MMVIKKIRDAVIGKPLNPMDKSIFHNLSLIAFFAWVGLGSDGLSSSCYGPEEAFLALHGHAYLSIFVALMSAFTIFIISTSYSQIIELFPSGGGGYLVASKLVSSNAGMVAGCALLIDYLLTIAISIASGSDALFSFLPAAWLPYKLEFAVFVLMVLIVVNMRGVKESVVPLVPIFLIFVLTHTFIILYAMGSHATQISTVIQATTQDIQSAQKEIGLWGMIFLIFRAYSFGAGTYTGIEAVSNGLSSLREPRVKTGKKTMTYMSVSLAFTVVGLMLAYLFYNVQYQHGKTLNAVLFETVSQGWGTWGSVFVLVSLVSEALILFVAAQTGFLGGPRVLANMALDRWFPMRFASLSDRLVTQNGIWLFGLAAALLLILTKGSVKFLVVLYSINVFITFCLSQLGMVRHWWAVRAEERVWMKKMLISGIGLCLTTLILLAVVILKFQDGGWITILVTGSLIALSVMVKRHYLKTAKLLRRLNSLVESAEIEMKAQLGGKPEGSAEPKFDTKAKTAVIMVNGYNGLGLHTLFNVIRFFGKEFRNFIFVQVGIIDAGNFKGAQEVTALQDQAQREVARYVQFMKNQGRYAEGLTYMATDIIEEVDQVGGEIFQRFPNAVFFGGQLVFAKETIWTKLLHNFTVFAMQRKFYNQGIPFVILPIRV